MRPLSLPMPSHPILPYPILFPPMPSLTAHPSLILLSTLPWAAERCHPVPTHCL